MSKNFSTLIFLFFIIFSIFAAALLWGRNFQRFTRAKEFNLPSSIKSVIFAYPYTVKADGKSYSKITVFVRNHKNSPLPNKTVILTTSLGSISPSMSKTDKKGKAEFTITSNQKGLANIEAKVENVKIKQTITIKFE